MFNPCTYLPIFLKHIIISYRKKKSSIMARITIPYAVTDFADLRERGFYYVDKTNYIPGLEDYNAPVFLRPRRFGKSLLISSRLTTTTVQRRIVLKNSSAVLGLANILRKSRLFPKRRGRRKTGAL